MTSQHGAMWREHCKVIAMFSFYMFSITTAVLVILNDLKSDVAEAFSYFAVLVWSLLTRTQAHFNNEFPISTELTAVVVLSLLGSVAVSVALVWWFRIRNFDNSPNTHLAGPVLLKYKNAEKHFAKKTKFDRKKGLRMHQKIWLPMSYELGNILIWGMQGSGKSNLIKWLISQLISRLDRVVIYDIKGEYTELFLDENSLLLSPKDERSVHWCLGMDITNIGLAEVFAEAVISSSSISDSFWTDSARLVVIGVIAGLIKEKEDWSWAELAKRLFSEDKELAYFLQKHHPQAATLIQADDKTTASIRAVVAAQLAWIKTIDQSSGATFSVQKWLSSKEEKTLIIQGDLTAPLMSSALITALMAVLSSYVLSGPDVTNNDIWLVIDELSTLNKSKSLERWLALGRSKGCRAIAGVQLLSQLDSIYGKDDANTVLGLFNIVVTFKLAPTGDSAEKASKGMGQRRVEYRTKSTNEKGEASYSLHQEHIPVVSAENIVHLPPPSFKYGIEGFLFIGGVDAVYQLHWPITQLQKIADAVVKKKAPIVPATPNKANRLNRRSTE